jgi:crotonobetainyl-CoA:carnitine CoA-transferase CaiB-like acyl-CoA transferase
VAPTRLGNAHPNIAPYQTFPAEDGHLIVAVGNDGQFARFVTVLGAPELAGDERFASNARRVANRAALTAAIEARTRRWRRDDLLGALEEKGVPAGPINTVAQVFADPQTMHRGMQIAPGGVPGVRTPIVASGFSLALERRAPALGEHDAEIRAELGL